jgi:hypothetical protein
MRLPSPLLAQAALAAVKEIGQSRAFPQRGLEITPNQIKIDGF